MPTGRNGWLGDGTWTRLVLAAALLEIVWLGFWVAGARLDARATFSERWELALPFVGFVLANARLPIDALLGVGSLTANVMFLNVVIVIAFSLYGWALRIVSRSDDSPRLAVFVVGCSLAFQFTFFWMPNLFSTDLFSYAVYGQIAGLHGGNPYLQPPAAFPQNPLLPFVSGLWREELSVYGPVWTALAAALGATLPPGDIVVQALVYKVVVNVAHLVSLALIWQTLADLRRPRAAGLLLYAWNPLVLFEIGANGHNDAVMIALMLGAVLLAVRRREIAGVLTLTLAAMVKYTAGLLLPYVVAIAAWRRQSLRPIVIGIAVALTTTAVAYLPWWNGWATLDPVLRWTSGPMFANSPVQLGVLAVAEGSRALGVGVGADMAGWLGRFLLRGALVVFWLWQIQKLRKGADLPAAGARLFIAFLLLGSTWVLPWYFSWPTALVALAGLETRTTRVVLGFDFTALALIYTFHFHGKSLPPWAFPFYLAPLLLALGLPGRFNAFARKKRAGQSDRRDIHTGAGHRLG